MNYQSNVYSDGIITNLLGHFKRNKHDAVILRENVFQQLGAKMRFDENNKYVLYGDQTYPSRKLSTCPLPNINITNAYLEHNTSMISLIQAVEWSFGKVITEFTFLDFKQIQTSLLHKLGKMYILGVILQTAIIVFMIASVLFTLVLTQYH